MEDNDARASPRQSKSTAAADDRPRRVQLQQKRINKSTRGRRYMEKKILLLFCSLIIFGILSHLKLTRKYLLALSLSSSLWKEDDVVERLMASLIVTNNTNTNTNNISNYYSTSQNVHQATTKTTTVNSRSQKRWAYAFLLAGCNVEEPAAYHGFLAGIVVSVRKLQQFGSRASFVVMIQMSTSSLSPIPRHQLSRDQQQANHSHHQYHHRRPRLSIEEEEMLQTLNIQIVYLPIMRSHVHECFYATVQEKFRILTLTQYERVLFVDADIIPKCNLDYLFELSTSAALQNKGSRSSTNQVTISYDSESNITQGTPTSNKSPALKETVILSWQNEASNAGFFMMTPSIDDWDLLQQAIRRREQQALKMEYPHWDEDVGWGHTITPPDYWRGMKDPTKKQYKWKWFSVHSDQGLLYYFAKYIKKDVSIIIGDEIETWSTTRNVHSEGGHIDQRQQPVELQNIQSHLFDKYSCKLGRGGNQNRLPPPYSDLHHFTGTNKPWESENLLSTNNTTKHIPGNILDWRKALLEIQDVTNFTFQFASKVSLSPIVSSSSKNSTNNMKNTGNNPPVGRFAGSYEMFRHIRAKSFFGWKDHYDEQYHDVYYVKN